MKKIIYILLVFVLAACGGTSTEFDKNLMKWNESNVGHYQMQVSVSCFCPFGEVNPITVIVKDNQVLSMMGANGVEILDTDPLYATLMTYATIDNLFDWTGQALVDADEIKVSYDETYGFPMSVAIDYITEAIDDEIWVDVSNFEVVE